MRLPISALVAAGLLTSQLAAAQCANPADNAAFDVTGLKTQLMVTALTCSADERYNQFINRYKSDLQSQAKSLTAYFSRAYGRSGTKQHDDYITNLANSQSKEGLKHGTLFCDRNMGVFDEVMALKGGSELPDYAAGKALFQPMSLNDCTTSPPRARTTAARRRS